jgi:hypothetical protein
MPPTWPPESSGRWVQALESEAARWGWILGETFIEDEPARPLLAYRHLRASTLAALREPRAPIAVMVSSSSEFADAPSQADGLRAEFERTTGIPVVVASSPPSDGSQDASFPGVWA